MKKHSGFTLIELMITLFIVGILAAIGLPSLKSFSQGSRLIAASNEMVSALHVARSEAIKQNVAVSVCASSDAKTCGAAATWKDGWIVFVDSGYTLTNTGAACTGPNTDCLLRVHEGFDNSQLKITGVDPNSVAVKSLTFTSRGLPLAANGSQTSAVFSVCGLDDSGSTSVSRAVVVSVAGRVRVSDNTAVISCP
ncbi:MAG TPA: prepilin-type N-terminal cleavage/methylation domain-containing protein [Gammaproteobacteria bacterium]|nr:prepilin-type N-terminal cleavage/methylation domain-containing protein [Gammaproteobacteria bacterium]